MKKKVNLKDIKSIQPIDKTKVKSALQNGQYYPINNVFDKIDSISMEEWERRLSDLPLADAKLALEYIRKIKKTTRWYYKLWLFLKKPFKR